MAPVWESTKKVHLHQNSVYREHQEIYNNRITYAIQVASAIFTVK